MPSTIVWPPDGSQLQAFSSCIVVILLALTLFMAVRLYQHNRRVTYRKLTLSLGLGLLHQLFQLALTMGWLPDRSLLGFVAEALRTVAFLLVNFALFELYHRPRPRTKAWFYALLGITCAIAATVVFSGSEPLSQLWRDGIAYSPVLDLFALALCPLFALMFAPHIGQPKRYVLSLAVTFAGQLAAVIDRIGHPDTTIYERIAAILPVAYFILLFMVLFERVVELLSSAYRSSITDGLTNLFNRRYFSSQLGYAVRSGGPLGAIFCDIDNFKKLNDTQGHQQADAVLKQVAAIIAEEVQEAGVAGRYGGEELVAFVRSDGTAGIAEQIRRRVEKETSVTVSVGFCQAGKGTTAESLLKRADDAMYHSKHNGKNRVTDYGQLVSHAG